jgi:hypothetical protein
MGLSWQPAPFWYANIRRWHASGCLPPRISVELGVSVLAPVSMPPEAWSLFLLILGRLLSGRLLDRSLLNWCLLDRRRFHGSLFDWRRFAGSVVPLELFP